jgi:Anti-sigma factor NepR
MEDAMAFGVFNPPKSARSSSLGFRSSLVLAKLGFDLRGHYEDLLNEPLPDDLGRLLMQLQEREVPRASLR